MPSRKRAKGKARKASQKESGLYLIDGECNHGILPLSSPRYRAFMDKFIAVMESSGPVVNAAGSSEAWSLAVLRHIKESNKDGGFFDLLSSEADKKWGRSYLLGMATTLVDSPELSNDLSTIKATCAVALLISEVEESETGWLNNDLQLLNPKTRDLVHGNERDVIRFLKKRVKCNCLNDLYKQTKKKLPKVGMCNGCQKKMERKNLMICNNCRVAQYCCIECQKQHWPEHKRMCEGAFGQGKRQC